MCLILIVGLVQRVLKRNPPNLFESKTQARNGFTKLEDLHNLNGLYKIDYAILMGYT